MCIRDRDNPRQDVQLVSVLRSALFGFAPDELTAIRLALPDGELWDCLLYTSRCV